jgi:hypothetical protein
MEPRATSLTLSAVNEAPKNETKNTGQAKRRRTYHREAGARRVHCVNVGEDFGLLARVQLLDLEQNVAETIGRIDADRLERVAVLGKQVLEEDGHGVAEKDLRRGKGET